MQYTVILGFPWFLFRACKKHVQLVTVAHSPCSGTHTLMSAYREKDSIVNYMSAGGTSVPMAAALFALMPAAPCSHHWSVVSPVVGRQAHHRRSCRRHACEVCTLTPTPLPAHTHTHGSHPCLPHLLASHPHPPQSPGGAPHSRAGPAAGRGGEATTAAAREEGGSEEKGTGVVSITVYFPVFFGTCIDFCCIGPCVSVFVQAVQA